MMNDPQATTRMTEGNDGLNLAELADMLERASSRIGHRIFLLSDEPYRRLRFDSRDFVFALEAGKYVP